MGTTIQDSPVELQVVTLSVTDVQERGENEGIPPPKEPIPSVEVSLGFSEDVGEGEIWEELLTTSKLLCSTCLKVNGVCSPKAVELKYTGENTAKQSNLHKGRELC